LRQLRCSCAQNKFLFFFLRFQFQNAILRAQLPKTSCAPVARRKTTLQFNPVIEDLKNSFEKERGTAASGQAVLSVYTMQTPQKGLQK